MKNWFNSLSPSERNLVFYGSILASLILLWMLVVEPLINNHTKLNKTITYQKNTLKVMQKQSSQVKQLQQLGEKSTQSSTGNPEQLIEKALQTWRLKPALERMQAQGSKGVRIVLKNAIADRSMRFLYDLENKHGLLISNLVINNSNKEAGYTDLRITVKAQ
jgi:type II secretory pathway component PulM